MLNMSNDICIRRLRQKYSNITSQPVHLYFDYFKYILIRCDAISNMQRMATKDIAHRTTNTREKKATFYFRRRVSLIRYSFGFESITYLIFKNKIQINWIIFRSEMQTNGEKMLSYLEHTHKKKTIFVRTNVSDYKPKHRVTVIT